MLDLCLSSGELGEVTATESCYYGTGSLLETAVAISPIRCSVVLGLFSVPLALPCPFSACSWLLATLHPLGLKGRQGWWRCGATSDLPPFLSRVQPTLGLYRSFFTNMFTFILWKINRITVFIKRKMEGWLELPYLKMHRMLTLTANVTCWPSACCYPDSTEDIRVHAGRGACFRGQAAWEVRFRSPPCIGGKKPHNPNSIR